MSHFKAVSSHEGKIKHVLFIFWEYLLPKPSNEFEGKKTIDVIEEIQKAALRYYAPVIDKLSEYANGHEVCFDIVIEHTVTISKRKDSEGLVQFREDLNLAWIKQLLPRRHKDSDHCKPGEEKNAENSDSRRPPNGLGLLKFKNCHGKLVRFVFTNVDFDEVAREAMRAIDFDSKFVTIGNLKELLQSVQDPFLPIAFKGNVVLLEPFFSWPTVKGFPSPFNFKFIPEILASQTEIMLRSFPFYFQGGNVLVGTDFVMMGGDVAIKNLAAFSNYEDIYENNQVKKPVPQQSDAQEGQLSLECFKILFAELMGLEKSIVIGEQEVKGKNKDNLIIPSSISENPQELFHLDTFLTLAGSKCDKDLVFLAKIHQWVGGEWVPGRSSKNDARLSMLGKYLEEVEGQLKANHFEIAYLPLLFHNHVFYSYNNCLIEVYRDGLFGVLTKRAYIPQFQFEELDKYVENKSKPDFHRADCMAKQAFCDEGFDPVLVDMHFRTFAHSRVGLHCMVSVLSRHSDTGLMALIDHIVHS
jgi:hypothetical protein